MHARATITSLLVTVALAATATPSAAETVVAGDPTRARLASAGDGFGTCGQAYVPGDGSLSAFALRDDGGTVAAFSRPEGDVLLGFAPDGAPDPTFGTDGVVTEPFGALAPGAVARIGDVDAVPESGFVVTGTVETDGAGDIAVGWLTPTGSLDSLFGGGDGAAILDLGGDERVAAGTDYSGDTAVAGVRDGDVFAAVVTASGDLDVGFDGDGWSARALADPEVHDVVTVGTQLIAMGSTGAPGARDAAFVGWASDGAPAAWGTVGILVDDLGGDDHAFSGAATFGALVTGAVSEIDGEPVTIVTYRDDELTPDPTWGDGGSVVVSPQGHAMAGGTVATTDDGVIVVGGALALQQGSGPLETGVGAARFSAFDGDPEAWGSGVGSEIVASFEDEVAGTPRLALRPDLSLALAADVADGRFAQYGVAADGRTDAQATCREAAEHLFDRLAGDNRYGTAAAISADAFAPGVDHVYIATGQSFPDALAISPVAGANRRPILLVTRDEIPPDTAAELARLRPGAITVVGGEQAVSPAVYAQLESATAGPVDRIAGDDRYATAAETTRRAFPDGVGQVYLATGENFPDALAGGAAAGLRRAAVLLTRTGSLPAATRTEIKRLRPTEVFILGGPSAVTAEVVAEVEATLGVTPVRLAGNDRIETALAVSSDTYVGPTTPFAPPFGGTVYLATSANFPDALAGGAAAALTGGPLLLIRGEALEEFVRTELSRLDARRVVILGGTTVVPPEFATDLARVGATDYSVLWVRDDGTPVRYDPCSPIHWVFNPDDAPATGLADVQEGFDRIATLTGLEFVYDGTTDEPVNDGNRELYQPDRYAADRWAPILVGWTPGLGSTGLGGSAFGGEGVYLTGGLALDADSNLPAGYGEGGTWGDVIVHEIGHVLGLAHVGDIEETMFPVLDSSPGAGGSTFAFGDGTARGLQVLAQGCLETPAPRAF